MINDYSAFWTSRVHASPALQVKVSDAGPCAGRLSGALSFAVLVTECREQCRSAIKAPAGRILRSLHNIFRKTKIISNFYF